MSVGVGSLARLSAIQLIKGLIDPTHPHPQPTPPQPASLGVGTGHMPLHPPPPPHGQPADPAAATHHDALLAGITTTSGAADHDHPAARSHPHLGLGRSGGATGGGVAGAAARAASSSSIFHLSRDDDDDGDEEGELGGGAGAGRAADAAFAATSSRLQSLIASKERELHDINQFRIETLEGMLRDRDRAQEELKGKLRRLRDDFQYNLGLIEERDAELDRCVLGFGSGVWGFGWCSEDRGGC